MHRGATLSIATILTLLVALSAAVLLSVSLEGGASVFKPWQLGQQEEGENETVDAIEDLKNTTGRDPGTESGSGKDTRYIFVTDAVYQPGGTGSNRFNDIKGSDGADKRCREAAENGVNKVKTNADAYQALISNGTVDAKDRIADFCSRYEYINLKGETVAVDCDDLWDTGLANAVNYTENEESWEDASHAEKSVWTGTNRDGSAAGDTCNNWGSGADTVNGGIGWPDETGAWWIKRGDIPCDSNSRLYCFHASAPTDSDTAPACNDGVDNDGDGETDYPDDPGCEDADDSSELDQTGTYDCDDGVNNDYDSYVDLDDPGCTGPSDTTETDSGVACDDGVDNDGNGDIDMNDPQCSSPTDTSESLITYTDFGEYSTGDPLTDSDWSLYVEDGAGSTNADFVVQDGSHGPGTEEGGNLVEKAHAADDQPRYALVWDHSDLQDVGDATITTLWRTSTSGGHQKALYTKVQTSGGDMVQTTYFDLRPESNEVRIHAIDASSSTALDTASFSIATNTWYWIEWVADDDTVEARIWEHGTTKPSTPTLSGTDTVNNDETGQVGIGGQEDDNTRYWDMFEVIQ